MEINPYNIRFDNEFLDTKGMKLKGETKLRGKKKDQNSLLTASKYLLHKIRKYA